MPSPSILYSWFTNSIRSWLFIAFLAKIENVGKTCAPDDILEGPDGGVHLTDIEGNGIIRWDLARKSVAV